MKQKYEFQEFIILKNLPLNAIIVLMLLVAPVFDILFLTSCASLIFGYSFLIGCRFARVFLPFLVFSLLASIYTLVPLQAFRLSHFIYIYIYEVED